MLWRAGFTVLEASGGEQALGIAKQHDSPIQLLLTDVLMPDMNGHDLAGKVTAARPEAKVLFMTGYRDKVVVESTGRPVSEGSLIRKPFTAHNLVAKIEEVLGGLASPAPGRP
jgi:DNA-binding NtrC family response regulator